MPAFGHVLLIGKPSFFPHAVYGHLANGGRAWWTNLSWDENVANWQHWCKRLKSNDLQRNMQETEAQSVLHNKISEAQRTSLR
jgi:hypothetical protein